MASYLLFLFEVTMHGFDLTPLWWWFGFLGIYIVLFVMWKLPPLKDKPLLYYFLLLGSYGFITLAFYVKFNYNFTVIAVSFLAWFIITGFKLALRAYVNHQARNYRR